MRQDELGTPLVIIVDQEAAETDTLVLRERDSTARVRAPEEDVIQAVKNLAEGIESWTHVAARLPACAAPI